MTRVEARPSARCTAASPRSAAASKSRCLPGSSESISEVGEVDLPVPREGLIVQSDSIVEQHRRLARLTQPQQTVARTGRDLRWSHPVQPVWITFRLELLELRASLGDGQPKACSASESTVPPPAASSIVRSVAIMAGS